MPQITRRMEFDAAHRVLGHEGKCRHLHGHRYVVEVAVRAPDLDPLGRVVDFSVLKERVGNWIDSRLDHNIILHKDDPLLPLLSMEVNGREPYVMQGNPTAENIAAEIYRAASEILLELRVVRVRVHETPNCWADHMEEFPC